MQKTTVETPTGPYSFYPEKGADLSTSEGRIEWFCAHFDVTPPKLQHDEDEPDQILLTDELLEWIKREGVSLDWALCGAASGALAVYREKYRITSEAEEITELLGKFDEQEHAILLAGLKMATATGADMDSVMHGLSAQIAEYRANKRG